MLCWKNSRALFTTAVGLGGCGIFPFGPGLGRLPSGMSDAVFSTLTSATHLVSSVSHRWACTCTNDSGRGVLAFLIRLAVLKCVQVGIVKGARWDVAGPMSGLGATLSSLV